ncbi:MAG TPA: hypothetical protein VFV83_08770 [Chthoniobacteraceae bacterium]|nr:hypothetical protein [Chthoniobacteraceae bacterium]
MRDQKRDWALRNAEKVREANRALEDGERAKASTASEGKNAALSSTPATPSEKRRECVTSSQAMTPELCHRVTKISVMRTGLLQLTVEQ